MLHPIKSGFQKKNHKLVAEELKFYLNCNTCSEIVKNIRKSPNDEIVVNLFLTSIHNVCLEVSDATTCKHLIQKFKEPFYNGMFSLVLTEDYLCGYIMPLCD